LKSRYLRNLLKLDIKIMENNDMENRVKNFKEEWIKIDKDIIPIDSKSSEFVITDFIQGKAGTKILLDDEKNVIEINFDGSIILARISDEGFRIKT